MKKLLTATVILVFILMMVSCSKHEPVDEANVMQIKNIGLRRDVFVRRYKMTSDYGRHNAFTPALLKEFIINVLEPDYLLIQHAYDKGMHKDPQIQRKINDYKVNTIANSHPIKFEMMAISSEELKEFYQKKAFYYDVDLVLTNSWVMAQDIYNYMSSGGKIDPPKEGQNFSFPRLLHYPNLTFGERMIHPAVLNRMEQMKPGEMSEPIYNSGIWTIITLKQKRQNTKLQPFESIERSLVEESQGLYRYQKQVQLLNELKEKYNIQIHSEYFPVLISSYVSQGDIGWIDKSNMDASDLNRAVVQIDDDKMTMDDFLIKFNMAFQKIKTPRIAENDLSYFADDYINQYLLYLDVLDKNIPLDDLTVDQLVNKEHRLLLSHYLKEEIAAQVVISDDEARQYYEDNRERWQASFDKVLNIVRGELRNERLKETKQDIVDELGKKYAIRYNDTLLSELAEQLTAEKSRQIVNEEI
ncbi:peptidyl-prolyl cis-trans isomerase [candidate division KSB1 bacterium]|nr:peptidyl-prolyl cis-trans isomerase [candidate division KSB1 bacterium]RQW00358.1 MAG: peptidyl-prolyl cis-trans isomerase [candidate division KSB1 bacterium]